MTVKLTLGSVQFLSFRTLWLQRVRKPLRRHASARIGSEVDQFDAIGLFIDKYRAKRDVLVSIPQIDCQRNQAMASCGAAGSASRLYECTSKSDILRQYHLQQTHFDLSVRNKRWWRRAYICIEIPSLDRAIGELDFHLLDIQVPCHLSNSKRPPKRTIGTENGRYLNVKTKECATHRDKGRWGSDLWWKRR